jgi:hypothetical protein
MDKGARSVYYRVVDNFQGDALVLTPKEYYEDPCSDKDRIHRNKKQPSICFSKSIGGCIFSIRNLWCPNELYIYWTDQEPDKDLSNCKYGDFAITKEVRYYSSVEVMYLRSIKVNDPTWEEIKTIDIDLLCAPYGLYYNEAATIKAIKMLNKVERTVMSATIT